MMRVLLVCLAVAMAGSASLSGLRPAAAPRSTPKRQAAPPPAIYPDVPHGFWAETAIQTVSVTNPWILPVNGLFKPAEPLTRGDLARAAAGAFVHGRKPFAGVTFADLAETDPLYASANLVYGLGWMGISKTRDFLPAKPVTKADVAQVLTRALGLKPELAGLDAIQTADGSALAHPRTFPALELSGALRLFANHPDESKEIRPSDVVPRDDGAYAIARAVGAVGTWRLRGLARFRTITLPVMAADRRKAVEFALSYVGYPYVYAGEWYAPTPRGFCCGAQPQGGFDCSGFVWWIVKAPSGGFDNTSIRKYAGWPLAERASYDMARAAPTRIAVADALPGDLLFSDTDSSGGDWRSVDHVGLALGGGWMIHSSGPGVSIEWVGTGWWPTHFKWARRLGQTGPPATPPAARPAKPPAKTTSSPKKTASRPNPSVRVTR